MTDGALEILDRLEDRLNRAADACTAAAELTSAQRRALQTLSEAIEAEGYRIMVNINEPGNLTLERGEKMEESRSAVVVALEAALQDLYILDSRLLLDAEITGGEYRAPPSLRLVEAALEKVGER